jgi:hypothetical protein
MVATDREGAKMRCPRCGTPFVLGSRAGPESDGPVEFLAFELFDPQAPMDEIEVLDDEPAETGVAAGPAPKPAAAAPVLPVVPVVAAAPVVRAVPVARAVAGEDRAAPRRPARPYRGDEDYYDEDEEYEKLGAGYGKYVFHPMDAGRWRLVYWGLSLVLFAILLYAAGSVLLFIALAFSIAGGAAAEGGFGILLIGFALAAATDVLRLVGYGLSINAPPRTMARGWAFMALGLALLSIIPAAIPLLLASVIENPFVLRVVAGIAIIMGLSSWGSYLMFMERICDCFDERGIADSVNAIIKLGGTWAACIIAGLIAQSIVLARDPNGQLLSGADPSALVLGVCAAAWQAFTAILGLVIFVKYIFALLNVRAMIEWST